MKCLQKLCCCVVGMVLLVPASKAQLFSLLSKEESGIDFQNTVVDEIKHNILIYSNYYGGAGVGIGDFNQDGLQDIYFAGNLEKDRLYLNQGNMHFRDITGIAGIADRGEWSSGVLVADVNNDGKQDIYITRELYDDKPELRRNALYINLGNDDNGVPHFSEEAFSFGLDDSARTRHGGFFDYDRDGDLDLLLLNQPPNPGNYSDLYGINPKQEEFMPRLYRQEVNGKFSDVSKEAGILESGYGNSLTLSDFDNDGWPDIYIANDYQEPDRYYVNNKDGTFVRKTESAFGHISFYSMGVDAADINNDGWLDLAVLDMVAEDNFRLKANMSGMNPQAFWDVVNNGGHYQYMYNTLHLNQGQNHFSEVGHMLNMASTDWSWSPLLADFDNDGWKDLYITNGLLRDIRNTDASKKFPKYVQKTVDKYVQDNPNAGDVSIWDILDLDDALQLIPSVPIANYAYKNKGGMEFEAVAADWGLDFEGFSHGAAYADLDNDGDLDLVVSNVNEVAHVYQNNSAQRAGRNYLRVALESSKSTFGARAYVYVDGKQQMQELTNVRGIYSSSENIFHFGLGNITAIDSLVVIWPDGSKQLKQGVEANQLLTMADTDTQLSVSENSIVSNTLFRTISRTDLSIKHQENNFDDYQKQVLLPHKLSTFGPTLAVGDLNGDKIDDIILGGAVGQAAQVLMSQKDGSYQKAPQPALEADKFTEDIGSVLFDADQDGDLDLYLVSGGYEYDSDAPYYQDRLYINTGAGGFFKSDFALPDMKSSGSCVKAFDYDNDGDIDLFVGGRVIPGRYPEAPRSYLLRNDGNAQFSDVTNNLAPGLAYAGMVTDAKWLDCNQDGKADLILSTEWMSLKYFENTENGLVEKTAEAGFVEMRGWWFSVDGADFDNDGDIDIIAGNLGLNYKYKASQEEPFHVFYDDFDENGSMDLVLGYYNDEKLYPLRGRSCSSEQIPVLKQKFPTYEEFAQADIFEVYGEENLDKSLHYTATEFASGYWENLGNGKFSFHRFPAMTQIAATNDFLIKDFDGDGNLDIVCAGNLYNSEIETPRSDAHMGLWLKGDGKGGFEAVSPQESGLYLPFEVRAIQSLMIAGQNYILASCNNERLQLIQVSNTSSQ